MANYRNLSQAELNIASIVFKQSVDFSYVFIADSFLPFNNVPVTIMYEDRQTLVGVPIHIRFWFAVYWGPTVYKQGANTNINWQNTLIHELTHVWQGQHGIPFMYMVKSMLAQGKAIVQHWDRNKAYEYDRNEYLKWNEYNVEQQGNIVQDWYDVGDGNQSVTDPRYIYIDKAIRKGNPNASDSPSKGVQAGLGLQAGIGPNGFDPLIYEVQNLLIRRGYKLKADGFYGDRTIAAIKDFQRKHKLKDDGFAGSKTLAKLRGR